MNTRHLSFFDKCCLSADVALRTLSGNPKTTGRATPITSKQSVELNQKDKKISSALMRINHCGEVCAQALYQGQALTAKLPDVREKMEQAALEENDHLHWCQQRLQQLDSHTSYLDPLFYLGSFTLGSIAGLCGDKWSLGFVAETERQVVRHLNQHLTHLPSVDETSRDILVAMQKDEQLHATNAIAAGGAELPQIIKSGMAITAKLMTKTTFYI